MKRATLEECRAVRAAYEAGESLTEIGARLGCGAPTILHRLRRAGGSCRSHRESAAIWIKKSGYRGPQLRGERNNKWKGGVAICNGYRRIKTPGHHRADRHGYVLEHILAAEKKIGRPITKDEIVHHINENKQDNRPENLEVMSRAAHMAHHDPHGWRRRA